MIYVFFVELLPQAVTQTGQFTGIVVFFLGIMVYISVDELLPMAHRYGHSHPSFLDSSWVLF
jgi:zinc transporter ZupT